MRWNSKKMFVAVALLAAYFVAPLQARNTATLLRWKNGDVLPGKLLEGKSNRIQWSSPLFTDDLIVDTVTLDSIVFPKRSALTAGAFRIATVSGDVFTADLIGSDDGAFLLSSERYGNVRVNRDAVYSLDRRAHPNLVFDGSQSKAWGVATPEGPVGDLTFKVYDGSRVWPGWTGPVPDLARLTPVEEGGCTAGYLDVGLTQLTNEFAIVFEGQLQIARESDYVFELSSHAGAELYIDGNLLGISSPSRDVVATVELGVGFHSLRVEYAKYSDALAPKLDLRWTGPDFKSESLTGTNPPPGWRRGPGGHLQADRRKARIFRPIEIPRRFEIELELTSAISPRFVLGLGKDESSEESNTSLRLETREHELVVVQGKVFEPVMTIEEDRREVRLRLALDSDAGELTVSDSAGRALLKLDDVQPPTGESGIFIRNRGEDLTVRRLRVYRETSQRGRQEFDTARYRVRMIDGQVVYGRLFVEQCSTYVVGQDERRRDVDLNRVDRIVRPQVTLTAARDVAELTYADGAVIRGRVEQANSDRVVLRTAFADMPVTCTLAGASLLRFGPPAYEATPAGRRGDELFYASGRLRGRLSFAGGESPLSWIPEGAARPLRLGPIGGARVELRRKSLRPRPAFDEQEFPSVLHLKNGEIFPCRLSSYNENTLRFQSPFIEGRKMDSTHLKAIEFTPSTSPDPSDEASSELVDWLQTIRGREEEISSAIEPVNLDRVLTVPRFDRHNPPSHVVVAKTGDIKRGKLLGIDGQTIRFESKSRKMEVPIDHIARVVRVGKPREENDDPAAIAVSPENTVRAKLWDGSILVFEAIASGDGKLTGRSSIYGEMAIPIDSIRRLTFGGFEREKSKSLFEEWVVRPAREPEFGKPSPSTSHPPNSEGPTASSPVAVPPVSDRALGLGRGATVDTPVEPRGRAVPVVEQSVPDLGRIRLDPRDRSLRFPVSINQRTGPVEYALVTDEGKTHESVFRTDAEPTHIHLALLLLGGKPVYARELPTDVSRELPGERVLIEIAWTDGAVGLIKPLGDFIVTTNNTATLAPRPWVYNGSVLVGKGLAAQMGGSIVSLRLDPAALINNPRPGRGNDELHHANPRAFPADPTDLQMIVRLAKDQQRLGNPGDPKAPNRVSEPERHDSP